MTHEEATSSDAAERYALGEMDDQERDLYEEHFFACPECAADVKAAVILLDSREGVRAPPEARCVPSPSPEPTAWWRSLGALFWPMPSGALAAAAVLIVVAGYLGLVQVPSLRNELREADSLQPTDWSFLSVSRSEPAVVKVSRGTRMVGLRLSRSAESRYARYRCDLREASGRVVLSGILPEPATGDELQVLIPVTSLPAGSYRLVLHGLDSATGGIETPDVAQYAFTLQREEES